MKKVFISQPMNGKSAGKILEEREQAIEQVSEYLNIDKNDIEIIDSYFGIAPNTQNISLWCLGRSLQAMSDADIVYFTRGWQEARGCKIEHDCAVAYEKERLYY